MERSEPSERRRPRARFAKRFYQERQNKFEQVYQILRREGPTNQKRHQKRLESFWGGRKPAEGRPTNQKRHQKRLEIFWGGRKPAEGRPTNQKRLESFWGGKRPAEGRPTNQKRHQKRLESFWGGRRPAKGRPTNHSVPYFGKHEGRSIWHLYGLGRPPKLDRNWFEAH